LSATAERTIASLAAVAGIAVANATAVRVVLDNFDGYVFDSLAWGGIWDIDPTDVSAPTFLW
jgi:hypothetical protein